MIKFVTTKEELRENLKHQEGTNQRQFSFAYYRDQVKEDANDDEMDAHYERFKKLLGKEDNRAPEAIAPYIIYFNKKYRKDNKYTQSDRNAAWEMFVELDTRIATQNLVNGSDKAALTSLSLLFGRFREISFKYGPDSRKFYNITYTILNNELRPLTSKWHTKLSDEKIEDKFRCELKIVQKSLNHLKEELNNISR